MELLIFHEISLLFCMLGLVLGGGAAKGYAHIGVIKVLDEIGIRPDIVVGASMGSLVGGFYAAGFTGKRMEEIALQVDKRKKRWLFPIRPNKRGFIDGRRVIKYLTEHLGATKIEDLPVKYAALATDIENHKELVINRGNLVFAIRASIAIPVVFTPFEHGGRILTDGGFVNPLPVTVAQDMGADRIIAVNVMPWVDYKRVEMTLQEPSGRDYNLRKVFRETSDIITSRLIDRELMFLKNGVVIHVDTSKIGLSSFEKARLAIDLGYETAKGKIEDIIKFSPLGGMK
jgi:NTE family protein